MAKKLVRKTLEMLRKLATEETEDEDEGEVSQHLSYTHADGIKQSRATNSAASHI